MPQEEEEEESFIFNDMQGLKDDDHVHGIPFLILSLSIYPPAKAGHMAKRRVGVEYSPSMLEPVHPGAVLPDRALCLPTFTHFLIVNKTSLSLSRSLSVSLKHFRGFLPANPPKGWGLPIHLALYIHTPTHRQKHRHTRI